MKTILTEVFGTALLLVMGGVSSAQAQLAYGNTVLNGCYGYLATSSDTESPPQNRSVVGTLCFDGAGNIVGVTGSPGLTGNTANTNGTVASASALTGTYKVTNSPGDGMGTWVLDRCTTEAFTINTLDGNYLAHGFQFELLKISTAKRCGTGPVVISGTAYYQDPIRTGAR